MLTSCATSVVHTPAKLISYGSFDTFLTVTVIKQTDFRLETGYTRSLNAGSRWERIGTITEGEVYKPKNSVFTIEGKHVHEAFLVIFNGHLVGFYLPVEFGFSKLPQTISVPFSSTL
jgi:hypothetical protein